MADLSRQYEKAIRLIAEYWLLERANKEVILSNPLELAEAVIAALREKAEKNQCS
jgi:hypothetical protein